MRVGYRLGLMVLLLNACASGRAMQAQDIPGGELPPPGYGSLKQDNVNLRMGSSDVELRFLPLDERLLRLLATDSYQSLHGLVESKRAAIDSAARASGMSSPGIVLVSFFALRNGAMFDPQNVLLSYRGQLQRPAGVVATTGNFTSRQLDVRQSATGLLLYDEPLPVFERFEVQYGTTIGTWSDEILRRLEREKARVQSRVAQARPDSTQPRP